jgi:hypothetical protein
MYYEPTHFRTLLALSERRLQERLYEEPRSRCSDPLLVLSTNLTLGADLRGSFSSSTCSVRLELSHIPQMIQLSLIPLPLRSQSPE